MKIYSFTVFSVASGLISGMCFVVPTCLHALNVKIRNAEARKNLTFISVILGLRSFGLLRIQVHEFDFIGEAVVGQFKVNHFLLTR